MKNLIICTLVAFTWVAKAAPEQDIIADIEARLTPYVGVSPWIKLGPIFNLYVILNYSLPVTNFHELDADLMQGLADLVALTAQDPAYTQNFDSHPGDRHEDFFEHRQLLELFSRTALPGMTLHPEILRHLRRIFILNLPREAYVANASLMNKVFEAFIERDLYNKNSLSVLPTAHEVADHLKLILTQHSALRGKLSQTDSDSCSSNLGE